MMLHQDGSTHQWVPGQYWDLVITLDDATSEHYSMFFVEQEGTASSFQGLTEVIERWGLPSSLYTDRGSHYWTTPEAGGKVDREHPTQFGRAMRQLGVEMIPAYSPEARGRCERMFATHQERLPKELAAHGIDTMPEANRYLAEHYRAAFNEEFTVPAAEPGSAFVPFIGPGLADIVCEHHERTVGRDHCVSFEGRRLQLPAQTHRRHFIKVRVRVHRYPDGHLAMFHGPRKLAEYEPDGSLRADAPRRAARGPRPKRGGPMRGPCGFVDESFGPARALRAVWTSPWTTLARRPPPCPHSRASRPQAPQDQQPVIHREQTGQPLCSKTGQVYLLPTGPARIAGIGDVGQGRSILGRRGVKPLSRREGGEDDGASSRLEERGEKAPHPRTA